jgi:hypothetical protein
MAKSAKINDLRKGAHKGRKAKTGSPNFTQINHPGGTRVSGSKMGVADPRLTAASLSAISPTPNGPSPKGGWPGSVNTGSSK